MIWDAEYAIVRAMAQARECANLSQKQLADGGQKMPTIDESGVKVIQ